SCAWRRTDSGRAAGPALKLCTRDMDLLGLAKVVSCGTGIRPRAGAPKDWQGEGWQARRMCSRSSMPQRNTHGARVARATFRPLIPSGHIVEPLSPEPVMSLRDVLRIPS